MLSNSLAPIRGAALTLEVGKAELSSSCEAAQSLLAWPTLPRVQPDLFMYMMLESCTGGAFLQPGYHAGFAGGVGAGR